LVLVSGWLVLSLEEWSVVGGLEVTKSSRYVPLYRVYQLL